AKKLNNFFKELDVRSEAQRGKKPFFKGCFESTTGLMRVGAVRKFAVAADLSNFGEIGIEILFFEIPYTEAADSRCVDTPTSKRKGNQLGVRCCMGSFTCFFDKITYE